MTPSPSRPQTVVEIVTCKLNIGVSDQDYIAASQATDAFVRNLPGFVSRSLSKSDDGTWTDYVTWSDMTSAKAATDAFPKNDAAMALVQLIDPSTLVMRHAYCLWSSS